MVPPVLNIILNSWKGITMCRVFIIKNPDFSSFKTILMDRRRVRYRKIWKQIMYVWKKLMTIFLFYLVFFFLCVRRSESEMFLKSTEINVCKLLGGTVPVLYMHFSCCSLTTLRSTIIHKVIHPFHPRGLQLLCY